MLRTNIRNGLAPGLNQPQSPESPAPATPAPTSSRADNMASDALASANTTSTNGPRLLAALSQPSIQELSQSPEAKAALKLNQAIAKRVRKATPPLSQRAQERLNNKIERFETLLYRGKVSQNQDVKDVVEAYTQVVRELASLGLMSKALSQSIDQGRNAVLQKFEDDLDMTFSPIVAGEQIIGLQATSNSGENLNAEQSAALDGARVLIFEMERIKAIPGQLRQKEIVLLDLRDALLRYSLESLQPAMLAPENLGTDNPIDVTSAALANVDAMLQSDAPLDVNILNDLKSLAADIESQNLQGLGAQLHGDVSITAPDAPQAPTTTINSNAFDTSAFARRAALRASSAPLGQMNAGQTPQFNTFHLNARNAELMNLVGTMPSDFAEPITSFTSAYTDAMENVEAMLPPGPFTYTMPVPFTIENDDGSSFTIPAGAELSQNPDGTGLITAPGMVMQSGDLQFISGEATVILGENIDNLYFETLNISQGDSDLFAMEEVNAQIDTENQSSIFEAQSATVNFSNGNVVFENTTMAFAPGSTVISAGTMLMENGNDQFSMEGFSFSQELNEDTATTSLVGDNTVMTFGENIFNAQHLEINLLQSEDPNNPGQMEMLVQGLDFQNADTSLQADEATLQMLSQADGSSSIVFASSDVDLMMANGQLNTQGTTQLEMNYDASGQIQNITTSADSLSFVDTAGNNLNTSGSTFNAEFNENGELTNLGVNAETLDFVSQDGSINASNGNIDLTYDNGTLSSASASATELAYSNGNQQLNANGGSLEMQAGTNGFVESLNASAQDVDYNDGTTQAMATNGSLNLSFDQDGNLLSAGGEAGSLTITNPESTIEAQNANFSANYGENGLLQSLNASSGDIQASGDFGVLQTQGQSSLDLSYHDNGNLEQLETSLGQVHFENPNGETLEITDGAAQMTFNEEGFLEGMTGNAEHLQWSNNDGSSLDAQGMNMNIVMGENGMLQSADASSGALTYTNAFGTLNTQGYSSVQMTCNDNGTITQLNLNSDDAHFVSSSDDVHALGGAAQLNFSESGQLISMDASANQVELQGAYGSLTTANQAQVNLDFNESGSLTQMQAQAASIQHTQGNSSLSLENGTLNADFSEDGLLSNVQASVATLTHVQDGNTLNVTDGQAQLTFGESGSLSHLNAQAQNLQHTQGSNTVEISNGLLNADFSEDGLLSSMQASADTLMHVQDGNALNITDGALDLDFDENGALSQIEASVTNGSYNGDFGSVTLSQGADFNATYNDGLLSSVNASVENLNYGNDQGQVLLSGATMTGAFGEDGSVDNINFQAANINFDGGAEHGQLSSASFDNAELHLTVNDLGEQTLSLSGENGSLHAEQGQLSIAEMETLAIHTGSDGQITQMQASFNGAIHFVENDGNMNVEVMDLNGSLNTQSNQLSISFSEAHIALQSEGLSANLLGANLEVEERETRLHLGQAELLKELADDLDFSAEIKSLDVVLKSGESGQLQELDIRVEDLALEAKEVNLHIVNEDGQQLRLNTSFSEDGTALRRIFMEIPEGGEVEICRDDNVAVLGSQTIELSHDPELGLWLSGSQNNIDATWDGIQIKADSENMRVGIDPNKGLVFDQINGTHIEVKTKDHEVNINIEALNNLCLRLTGIEDLAQGARLELVAADESADSELTARLSTTYNGIPMALEFDNIEALEVAGSIQTNQVHLIMADPGGEGTITAEAGSMKLEGSALEFYVRYNEYDPNRLMNSVGRFLSSDGVQLTKSLSVESDGVVRLSKQSDGIFGELSVLLPRGGASAPSYAFSPGSGGGAGVMLNAGGAGTTKNGTRYVGSVFVGALPGSYLEYKQTQGETSIAGIKVPKRFTLPSTLTAGVNFRRHGTNSRFDATIGAYVNPAARAPSELKPYLHESNIGGAFAGFNLRRGNLSTSLEATGGISGNGKLGLEGVRLSVGIGF